MVKPEKFKNALYALHLVLVRARYMAYTNEDKNKIAMILDWTEILPKFIASEEDETERFRGYIEDIVEKFPICRPALMAFDDDSPPQGW